MDPDANLKEQAALAREILAMEDEAADLGDTWERAAEVKRLAYKLAAHVEALDEWMRKGGYLPAAWKR